MRAYLLVAAIASVGLIGCVGQFDSGTGGVGGGGGGGGVGGGGGGGGGGSGSGSGSAADTAREAFNTNVYVTIAAKCGASGCHSDTAPGQGAPGFVDVTTPSIDDHKAYDTVVNNQLVVGDFSTSAPILAIPSGSHFATYSTDEKSAITNWLNLESQWRNAGSGSGSGSGNGSGTQPLDLMGQFSGCLKQTDFDAANMAQAWANNIQTNEGVCKYCHVNVTANFVATVQNTYMFSEISTNRAVMSTFFTIDTTVTPNKVVINQMPFKVAASGLTASGQHPRGWDPTNNQGMQALQQFYTTAAGYLAAGTCGPKTLTN